MCRRPMPYINQMLVEYGVAADEKSVGYLSGSVEGVMTLGVVACLPCVPRRACAWPG
jgi:hypothetical protein